MDVAASHDGEESIMYEADQTGTTAGESAGDGKGHSDDVDRGQLCRHGGRIGKPIDTLLSRLRSRLVIQCEGDRCPDCMAT